MLGEDYVALELATLFGRLCVRVNLFSPSEQILAGCDPTALRLVQAGLRKLGIPAVTKTAIESVMDRPVVISQGVSPHTAGLHLDAAGLTTARTGSIAVNAMQQSTVPH